MDVDGKEHRSNSAVSHWATPFSKTSDKATQEPWLYKGVTEAAGASGWRPEGLNTKLEEKHFPRRQWRVAHKHSNLYLFLFRIPNIGQRYESGGMLRAFL